MTVQQNSEKISFTAENEARFQKILPHYPTKEAALIPSLHIALEQFGYLSSNVMEYIADKLELPPSKVLAVSSFYTMLHRDQHGKYNIQVCRTLPCALAGSESIISHLEKKLGIKAGETTPDGKFTLSKVECLASCGSAPVLQVNTGCYHENLTTEKLDELIDHLRKSASSSGA